MSGEPHPIPADGSERDEQLQAVIAEYIRSSEAGRPLVRQDLLHQYPEFAAELTQFFEQRDQMNRLADPIRAFKDDLFQAVGPGRQLSYVGNYELLEEVARGGMGVVYKARQTTLGRIVAVKMIVSGQLANEQDVQRFKSEAQAAASLHHPSIVPIHEVGQHEGWHYFSMDYVEGHDLAAKLRLNLPPARTAATYVRQMAEAIHYAHQQGILHRDLKPSNILVDETNQIHITDFGLAMRVEGDQGLTQTGQILGTPSYMPPEQAQCKRELIGPASDVYSLGAILYECLTGRPPFRAESVIKTIEQVIHADAASPRTLNSTVPRDLETICLKCLEKEPHRRYATARLLQEDLGRFLSGEPIVARPARALERTAKWIRRHPMSAAFIASSMVALLAVTGVGLGLYYNAQLDSANSQLRIINKQQEETKQTLVSSNQQLEAAKQTLESSNQQLSVTSEKLEHSIQEVNAERALARRHLYASRMALIQIAERNGETARIVQLLRSLIPESEQQEDLRDFEWNYLWRKYHGELFQLKGHKNLVSTVAVSPDNQWIASGDRNGTLKIWNANSRKTVHSLQPYSSAVQKVAFSVDSKQIVSASEDLFIRWNTETGHELERLDIETGDGGRMKTATFLASFCDASEFQAKILKSKTTFLTSNASGLRIDAEVKHGASGTTSTLNIYNSTQGTLQKNPIIIPLEVTCLALATNGKYVATGGSDQVVRVWSVESADIAHTLYAPSVVNSVAFSADSSQIVAGTEDGLVLLWVLPGSEQRVFFQGGRANCVSFGSEGQLLASVCKGNAIVWAVSSGEKLHTLPMGRYSRIALSPHRRWIAGTHSARLYDLDTNSALLPEAPARDGPFRDKDGPFGVAISQDEAFVARTSLENRDSEPNVNVHSKETGEILKSISMPKWQTSVAFSSSAGLFAASSSHMAKRTGNGAINVSEIYSSKTVYDEEFSLGIWCLSFSPDGKFLAAAMGNYLAKGDQIGSIRVWNTQDWRMVYDLRGHQGSVWTVTFNPSGTRLASAGGIQSGGHGKVKIWDMATGDELLTIDTQKGAFGVDFSPDSRLLAIADGDGVILRDGGPLMSRPEYQPLPSE